MKSSLAILPAAAAVLTVAVMLFQGRSVEPELMEENFARLGELRGFKSEIIEPSEAELSTLPKDTIFDKRMYQTPGGDWMLVSLVIGGRSKSSLHRPEICLPSQGVKMSDPTTVNVGGVDWHALKLEHGKDHPIGFAYTFYNQAGYQTSSHIARIFRDVIDRSLLGRVDRWAMMTVQTPHVAGHGLEAKLSLLKKTVEGIK